LVVSPSARWWITYCPGYFLRWLFLFVFLPVYIDDVGACERGFGWIEQQVDVLFECSFIRLCAKNLIALDFT
jgi:hypothetical protein